MKKVESQQPIKRFIHSYIKPTIFGERIVVNYFVTEGYPRSRIHWVICKKTILENSWSYTNSDYLLKFGSSKETVQWHLSYPNQFYLILNWKKLGIYLGLFRNVFYKDSKRDIVWFRRLWKFQEDLDVFDLQCFLCLL